MFKNNHQYASKNLPNVYSKLMSHLTETNLEHDQSHSQYIVYWWWWYHIIVYTFYKHNLFTLNRKFSFNSRFSRVHLLQQKKNNQFRLFWNQTAKDLHIYSLLSSCIYISFSNFLFQFLKLKSIQWRRMRRRIKMLMENLKNVLFKIILYKQCKASKQMKHIFFRIIFLVTEKNFKKF